MRLCWLPAWLTVVAVVAVVAAEEVVETLYWYHAERDGLITYETVHVEYPDCGLALDSAGQCGNAEASTVLRGCPADPTSDTWLMLKHLNMQSLRRFGGADGEFHLLRYPKPVTGYLRGRFPDSTDPGCTSAGASSFLEIFIDNEYPIEDSTTFLYHGSRIEQLLATDGMNQDLDDPFESSLVAAIDDIHSYVYLKSVRESTDGAVQLNEVLIQATFSTDMPEEERSLLAATDVAPDFVPVYVNTFENSIGPEGNHWAGPDSNMLTFYSIDLVPGGAPGECDYLDGCFGSLNNNADRIERGAVITLSDLPAHDLIDIHMLVMVFGAQGETRDDQVYVSLDGQDVLRSTIATVPGHDECWPLPPGCDLYDHKPAMSGAYRSMDPSSQCDPLPAQGPTGWYYVNVTVPHTASAAAIKLGKEAGPYVVRMSSLVVAVHPTEAAAQLPEWLLIAIFAVGGVVAVAAIVVIVHSTKSLATTSPSTGMSMKTDKKKHAAAASASSAGRRKTSATGKPRKASRNRPAEPARKRLSFESAATMATSGSAVSTYGSGDDYGQSSV